MLSYQHSYHAGNPADVHKHLALSLLFDQLQQKEAPLCYVDANAGRGLYDLHGDEARKTGDAEGGIGRLFRAQPSSAAIRLYLDRVMQCNATSELRFYPGSASLAQALMRSQDKAILMELHPQEHAALRRVIGRDSRIAVHARSCYEGLPALLPPTVRRGLVLIDPSYEVKQEYESVVDLLLSACRQWATPVFVLWYPLLPEQRHEALVKRLPSGMNLLCSEFRWRRPSHGLYGSGLIIINTPWQFASAFDEAMKEVVMALKGDDTAGHRMYEAGGVA